MLPPPGLGLLAAGLGITSVLLVWGLLRLAFLTGKPAPHALIACCALISLVCVSCFPLPWLSSQFITTLLVPAVLVGALPWEPAVGTLWKQGKLAMAAIVLLLAVNSFTAAVLWRANIGAVARGEHRTASGLLAAYQWLHEHSQPREVVLASFENSNRIPRSAHNTVFCGYAFTTVRYEGKAALVDQFFRNDSSDAGAAVCWLNTTCTMC